LVGAGLVWYLDRTGKFLSPNIFERIDSLAKGDTTFDSGRLMVWGQSARQILARPLFGSGPEGYWISGCCERAILQAHNFVLQFLLELGLVGCVVALLLLACAVRGLGGMASARHLLFATPVNRVLAGLVAAYLAYSLIDQTMYHLLPLLHFALFAGLLAAGLVQARAAARRGPAP
jgi:O-antigen ligase